MGNMFKTAFLLTLMTLLLMFIGRAFGGQNGLPDVNNMSAEHANPAMPPRLGG